MSQNKIKELIEAAGLKIQGTSISAMFWTFKMTVPVEKSAVAFLEKTVSLVEDAGYEIYDSGVGGDIYWVKVVNPIHASGYIAPTEPEPIVEPESIPNSTIGIDLNSTGTVSTDTSHIDPAIEPEEEIPEEIAKELEE